MNDTEPRIVVGNIQVKRCEGGYGHFCYHTGERLDKRQVWTRQVEALQAAKRLDWQNKARVEW